MTLVAGHDQPESRSSTSSTRVDSSEPSEEAAPPSVSVVTWAQGRHHLPGVIERLPIWVSEVIVVDSDHRLAPVGHEHRAGPTQPPPGRGLAAGLATSTGDIIVVLSADGSADPAEIPRYVAALRTGADFVKGSRFLAGGSPARPRRLPRAGDTLVRGAAKLFWDLELVDLTYGYLAFWRRHLVHLRTGHFELAATGLTLSAARSGLVLSSVPSTQLGPRGGQAPGSDPARSPSGALGAVRSRLAEQAVDLRRRLKVTAQGEGDDPRARPLTRDRDR